MVRKISSMLCAFALIFGFAMTAHGATHSVYENGSLSSTYVTYFKDILSGAKFNDNYVAFRSGQYSYSMIVGDIDYTNGQFKMNGVCKEYVFSTNSSNYNSQYYYEVNELSNFNLDYDNAIIYSDLGDFPQLVERGAKYEMLTTLILCVACLCFIIRNIFYYRKR